MGGAAPATEARLAPRRPSQAGPGKGWASDAGSEVVAVLRQNLAARCTGRSYICPTNTDELVTKRSSCFLFDETTATPAMSSTRGHAHWDPAISIPTLVGSAVSVLATTTVILLWTFAPGKKRRDFRYALILNLTVAEFINSLNNTVSGIAVAVRRRPLVRGPACKWNGWTGQFSVVAVDFSILAIGIVTLLTIQLRSSIIYASTTTKALICVAVWIVPLCNSLIAWFRNYYGPVSGNWCWIEPRFMRQRFSLNHGWRIAIFIISLCTYAFVFFYMSRRVRPQNLSISSARDFDSFEAELESRRIHGDDLTRWEITPGVPVEPEHGSTPGSHDSAKKHRRNKSSFTFPKIARTDSKYAPLQEPMPTHQTTDASRFADTNRPLPVLAGGGGVVDEEAFQQAYPATAATLHQTATQDARLKVDREIWRILLLNMYPVTYLILWIPGIANRIAEGLGHNIRALTILQSSTQFIGLADATIYIYQEHRKDVRKWWASCGKRSSLKSATTTVTPRILSHGYSESRDRPWSTVTA